eukprot:4686216-Pyramimonas_sp.AAC.1
MGQALGLQPQPSKKSAQRARRAHVRVNKAKVNRGQELLQPLPHRLIAHDAPWESSRSVSGAPHPQEVTRKY